MMPLPKIKKPSLMVRLRGLRADLREFSKDKNPNPDDFIELIRRARQIANDIERGRE